MDSDLTTAPAPEGMTLTDEEVDALLYPLGATAEGMDMQDWDRLVARHFYAAGAADLATLRAENERLRKDAEVWRHIAQERYADYRKVCDPKETGYPIEGALDSLFAGYRKGGKHSQVFCSQCGCAFGPNYHGYSHCTDHAAIPREKE